MGGGVEGIEKEGYEEHSEGREGMEGNGTVSWQECKARRVCLCVCVSQKEWTRRAGENYGMTNRKEGKRARWRHCTT